jgi:hypothetical protein
MKKLAGLLALLLLAAPLGAQTVTKSLEWDEPEAIAVVSTFITTVKIDAASAVQVTPTYSTATAPGMLTHGKTPITLTAGTHTIVLTVTNPSGVSASAAPLNYNPGVAPGTPVSVVITVTITVP